MIYVYAFCPAPATPLALPEGITDTAIQVVTQGQLAAIAEHGVDVAEVKEDDTQLMAAVLAHDRVLGQLFTQTVLLPLRFGTQFTSEDSLHSYLQAHQTTYRQRLEALENKAEYLLKLAPLVVDQAPLSPDLKGRDYFLAKKQRLQTQAQIQTQRGEERQQFLAQLERAQIPYVQSPPHADEERLHLLLERDPAIAQTHLMDWQQHLPHWQLTCSDPLPPYHFATYGALPSGRVNPESRI